MRSQQLPWFPLLMVMRKKQNREQRSRGAREQGSSSTNKSFSALYPLLSALAGGILMGLTVAPVSAWPLAWIALVPLWVQIVLSAEKKQAPSALLGLAWGIGYHGVALFWIVGIHPMTWMGVPWLASLAIALFCLSFITLWGAALVAVWAAWMRAILDFRFPVLDWVWLALQQKTLKPIPPNLPVPTLVKGGKGRWERDKIQNRYVRVLIGVALWCALESLWSHGPLWWSSLSYTQSPHNLAILHLGQISGPTAVTVAIVAVNGLIAEAWIASQKEVALLTRILGQDRQKKELFVFYLLPFIFCLILHLIGFALYSRPLLQPPAAALKVGIVQGNIPNEIKLYSGGLRRAIEGYTTGYRTLAEQGVDAVLTPEGALPFLWNQQTQINSSFYAAVKQKGVVAWLGTFGSREGGYSNSLFTIAGNGEIYSRYDKATLVPLGEYVPFEEYIGSLINRLSPLDEHQIPGLPNQVFDTPFGRAIVGICYESAFAEHFRRQAVTGGQFILSASNDAHYSKAMPAQHHAQDVMRAIETDRWAVRATNTGYSAIVDPQGRTKWISRINTFETHAETIYRRQTQTLYVRWGDWLTPVLLAGGGLAWVLQKRD